MNVAMAGISDGHTDLRIRSSGLARQASCLHNLVSESMTSWEASDKAAYFNFNAATFASTGSFQGLYYNNTRKWSDDNFVRGLWRNALKSSGLKNPEEIDPRSVADPVARAALYKQREALYTQNLDTYISCQRKATFGDAALRGGKFGGGDASLKEYACWTGMVFLDAQCRLVPIRSLNPDQIKSCTSNRLSVEYWASTPISLIFEGEGDPMGSYKIVKFPLDPSTGANFWEWRGSSAAPLLVYDPQHKGEISSAEQVFGVWALGGKPNHEDSSVARTKWAHGFEALATLDADGDERISGDELAPLGLWFDSNEDAISQPGEVRPVSEVGIEALFFKVGHVDDQLGDVIVNIGYHRKIDGALTTGKAVDWRARGHATAEGLLLGRVLGGDGALEASGVADATSVGGAESESAWDKQTALQSIYSPAGFWRVTLEPESPIEIKEKVGETILAFNVSSPNFLEGYTFSEVGLAGMQDAARAIGFTYTSGSKSLNVDGTIQLTFAGQSEFARLENTATLQRDGTTMRGRTVAHLAGDKQLKYSWRAVKMGNPSDAPASR
jgi:hypothetical protein